MGRLILRLLGTPEVNHEEHPLILQTRKVLALLVYLAVEQGIYSRDKITALLWPESDEERGKASLRRALAYLRESLDETAHDRFGHVPQQPPHVLIERHTLSFNGASDFEIDTQTLQAAFTLTRRRSSGDLRTQLAHLQMAASSYGGNFLDGFSLPDAPDFEDWLLLQRESWRRQANTVFDYLSQWQLEAGELENALENTTRWVEHDLLNESAHTRLMQLHVAFGDRTAALRAFERCRSILERELSVDPSSEIVVLAERIRSQASPVGKPVLHEVLLPRDALEFPFTGRATEHRELVTAFQTIRQGRTQVATIEGEPGIGKTRLAREFLRWVRAQGAEVLEARAFETGSRLPYQPLIEAMRGRLEREQDLQALLSDIWLAELARLLPELREQLPDLPPLLSLGEAEARTRLFEAMARLGHALARRAPVMLFIDDAQWADAASLDVLQYASRRWATAHLPVLLLYTFRSDDLARNTELAEWLSSLERFLPVRRQTLTSLPFEETLQLIQSLFVAERGPTGNGNEGQAKKEEDIEVWSRWLFDQTRGHPFMLVEYFKLVTERRDLLDDEAGTVRITADLFPFKETARSTLPVRVRDLIHERFTRLSQTALTLCMAAAVLGDGFTFDQLCHVADLTDNQGLSALDEVLMRGLLQETDGRCFFAHDSIHAVAYAEAGEIRRRVLHRRALETLQAAMASPAELAYHALAAGLTDAAARLSIAAGDAAMRLFAARDAITQYEQARQLLMRSNEYLHPSREENAAVSLDDLCHLSLQLGWAYELSSQFAQAESIYEEMLSLARAVHEPVMECSALNRLATLTGRKGQDLAQAQELLQQALVIAESSQNIAGVAETVSNLAQTGFYAGKMSASLPYAERALALARSLNQQELIGRSLHALATLESVLGRWEESLSHAEEARMLYAALGNLEMEVGCLCVIARTSIDEGKLQEGIDAAKAALAMSEAIEDPWGQINAAVQLVPGLLDRGAYTDAFVVIQRGVAFARALEITPLLVLALNQWGNVNRAMLALEAAHTAHSEALTLCESFMPQQDFIEWIAGELCADCALAGQWQQAYTYALKALAAREYSMMHGSLTRWHETEALLRGGSIEEAREDVRRFGESAHNKRRYGISYLRALAALAQWDHEIDQAITHLEAARVLAEQLGLPGELWQLLAILGELYQSSRNESQAQQAYAHAAQIVQSLADRIENEQQRTTFLSVQRIRTVLEQSRADY
jgi:DNA-binding SARP family transcriptional activator/predicted ATPase